jgi:hypothetical protein
MVIEILYLIILGFVFLFTTFFVSIAVVIRHQNIEKRKSMMEKFDTYAAVLQYHMERSYEIIHKDQILIYSLEATGVPDEMYNNASNSFCRLVIKLVGPMIYKELQYLYGDDETLTFNMAEYFSTKYDEDEIRSSALDSLTSDEEEE